MTDLEFDNQLMLAYAQGDANAFAQLYERYASRVYGLIRKSKFSEEETAEIFQTVFEKLHAKRDRYQGSVPFGAWIFTITKSTIIDVYRKKSKYHFLEFNEEVSPVNEQWASPETTVLAGPLANELNAKEQEAINLRYYQDLDFDAIALQLEMKPLTVRQLISRAIRKLRTKVVA